MERIQPAYFKQYKYMLYHPDGSIEISEPIGWNDDDKVFKRSLDTHGIFINLANNLEFYHGDEYNDGGYNILKSVYNTYGINSKVLLIKEENISGIWYEAYRGYLDFSTYIESQYSITLKINESGLYELIKARNSDELELDRLTTMNGTEIPALKTETVRLDGRKILIIDELNSTKAETSYNIELPGGDGSVYIDSNGPIVGLYFGGSRDYGAVIIPLTMIAEQAGNVQTIYDYQCPVNDDNWGIGTASSTGNMFYDEAPNDKQIKINIDIEVMRVGPESPTQMRVELVKYGGNLGLEFVSSTELIIVNEPGENVKYSFTDPEYVVDLLAGQSLALIVHCRNSGDQTVYTQINKANIVISDETFADPTECKFVMPFEALERIINIITNLPNKLFSNALGRIENGYSKDGDSSLTGLTNGLWVREFNTAMITTSFKDFMDSFGCIWQLGYGIEKLGFTERIRVEHVSYFYNENVTIRLNKSPNNIVRKCAKEYFYSSLNIGYSQPSGTILYEEALGLDEYNIQNTYTTPITRVENKLINISKYRADSYGTEFARRKPKAKFPEEDTRYDLNVMALDLKRGSGQVFEQRKWIDDFVVPTPFDKNTTGVYSPETATNLRFSPMNTLKRMGYWIKGGFMKNLSEYVRYSSSNGNSSLKTESIIPGSFETAENGNVLCSDLDKNLFNPEIISFEYSIDTMTMKMINGTTVLNDGTTIMNYYGLVEFINEYGEYEYGYLMNLEPNGEGKIELLSSTKRISKFASPKCEQTKGTPPTSLLANDVTENYSTPSVLLTWNKAVYEEGISHYRIYLESVNGDKLIGNTLNDISNYTINNLELNIQYSFYVIGVTSLGKLTKMSNIATITLTGEGLQNILDFDLNKYL